MKNLLLITLFFLAAISGFSQFQYGCNPGYYGAQRTDQMIYDLMFLSGARATRSTVSLQFELQYGMPTYQTRLQYPYSTKGMRGNVFNLTATAGPAYTGQGDSVYGKQTWLPKGIYNAAFNADGSINTANVWAKYCYDVVQSVGPYFQYFEVWNEPDLTGSVDSYEDSTQSATSWQKVEPQASVLTNMNAPVEDYVQLCKIANEVIKKYQPNAKIATGGIGYEWFYMWFLRKGGGQWVDELSYHDYAYWDWCTCVWNGSACDPSGFHRNSDYAVTTMLQKLNNLRAIETQEHATHLPAILTEHNLPRWSYVSAANLENINSNKQWGNDTTQRNYTIKSFAKLFQAGLEGIYLYQTGETGDSGLNNGSSGSEIDAMGMYKNLQTAQVGKEVMTNQGIAIKSIQGVLTGFKVNNTLLPVQAGSDAVEFDSSGIASYIMWAVTTLDLSDKASCVRTLPPGEWDISDWTGKHLRICSDTIHLTGDPYYCKPHNTALALIPPPIDSVVRNTIKAEIYPNPANDYFTVDINSSFAGAVLISVFDMYGHLVKFYTASKNVNKFSKQFAAPFPSGIYAVRISVNAQQSDLKKLIIIK